MKRRSLILAAALLTSGCTSLADRMFGAPYGPPPDTQPYQPFPEYRLWWAQVEGCSGRARNMDEIRWFMAPEYPFTYHDYSNLAGIYLAPRTIIMADLVAESANEVRHEMLHAIENSDSHATHHGACKGLVTP